jgi:Transglutaminase-like superfamily
MSVNRHSNSQMSGLSQTGPPPAQRKDEVQLLLVCRVLLGLIAFDLLGLGRDFAKMNRYVTRHLIMRGTISKARVECVCEAVNYACIWYPKRVLCLQRSVVTTCLLRTCGVSASMVIGAQTLPFKAHAWTEVDSRAINERRDVQSIYTVLQRC